MSNREEQDVQVDETVVLEKFDGEPAPENLVERMHIKNGMVVGVETISDGRVVDTQVVDPDNFTPSATDSTKEVD